MSACTQKHPGEATGLALCPRRLMWFVDALITISQFGIAAGLSITLCLPTSLAADDRGSRKSASWAAVTPAKSGVRRIRPVAANATDDTIHPPDDAVASTDPTAPSLKSEESDSVSGLTVPAEHQASVIERLKQAIQAERESRGVSPEPPVADGVSGHANPVPSLESIPAVPTFPLDPRSPEALRREKADRFLRLERQLLQFRTLSETGPSRRSGDANPDIDEAHKSHDTNRNHETEGNHETGENDGANAATLHQSEPGNQSIPAAAPNLVRSPLTDHAVIEGPIDRLGLANNLYAVGDYLLALEMYEQADTIDMTAQQQIWTEYQIANCLRRAGRIAEASNRYRRLADQPEAGWLSDQSQWWVDVLEQMRMIRKGLETKVDMEPATL